MTIAGAAPSPVSITDAADPAQTPTYTLSVNVKVGGVNASGVMVTLSSGGAEVAKRGTDGDGNVRFDNLKDGTYTLKPGKDGCTFTPVPSVVIAGAAPALVLITGTQNTASTYVISGTVSDGSRKLPGVTLTLTGGTLTGAATTTTDGNGAFAFAALGNGDYLLKATLAGHAFTDQNIHVQDEPRSVTLVGTPNTYAISGVVVAGTKKVAGAVISLTGGSLAGPTSVTSDAEGTFAISGLRNGTYTLSATLAGHVFAPVPPVVIQDGTPGAVTISAILRSISGTITSPEVRTRSYQVTLAETGTTVSAKNVSVGTWTYTLAEVPPGQHTVTAQYGVPTDAQGWFPVPSQVVDVREHDAAGVNFEVSQIGIGGLWGTHKNQIWATSSTMPYIYTWDGTRWTFTQVGDATVANFGGGISGSDAANVWAIGKDSKNVASLWRTNGGAWSKVDMAPFSMDLARLWVCGANDVWLVGRNATSSRPLLIHWNGTGWEDRTSNYTDMPCGIWGAPDGQVWVIGSYGVWKWNPAGNGDAKWQRVAVEVPSGTLLTAIYGFAANDIWLGTNSNWILHLDGSTVTREECRGLIPSDKQSQRAFWGTSSRDLWVVASSGNGGHRVEASWSLRQIRLGTGMGMSAVWGAEDVVWVGGANTLDRLSVDTRLVMN